MAIATISEISLEKLSYCIIFFKSITTYAQFSVVGLPEVKQKFTLLWSDVSLLANNGSINYN